MRDFKFNVGDTVRVDENHGYRASEEFVVRFRGIQHGHRFYSDGNDHGNQRGVFEHVLTLVENAPIGDPDDSPVEHPKHYNSHPSGVECITIARHHNFNIGNVFKYLWRLGLKGEDAATKGKRVEEIDKAIFYLQDERARILA